MSQNGRSNRSNTSGQDNEMIIDLSRARPDPVTSNQLQRTNNSPVSFKSNSSSPVIQGSSLIFSNIPTKGSSSTSSKSQSPLFHPRSLSPPRAPRLQFDSKGKARMMDTSSPLDNNHSYNHEAYSIHSFREPAFTNNPNEEEEEDSSHLLLQCPICGVETSSLHHLNYHIDREHPEDQMDPTEALVSWFKKAQSNVFNKKWKLPFQDATKKVAEASLEGFMKPNLGVFELNSDSNDSDEPIQVPSSSSGHTSPNLFQSKLKRNDSASFSLKWTSSHDQSSPRIGSSSSTTIDYASATNGRIQSSPTATSPDSLLPRHHWQHETANDTCGVQSCGKTLGIVSGKIHCRKCGKLYCDLHTRFQMRLTTTLKHDATSGIWARVCIQCYEQREGYNDINGVSRNRTAGFLRLRNAKVNRSLLERNLIALRLDKLSQMYQNPQPRSLTKSKSIADFIAVATTQKGLEKTVVTWESDKSSTACTLCGNAFSLLNRRHHCRLCGSLVDGSCTLNYVLPKTDGVIIKICKVCNRHIESHQQNAILDDSEKPVLLRLYEAIVRNKAQVQDVLPSFHGLLVELRKRSFVFAEDQDYKHALQNRKVLMEYFSEIDRLAKAIKKLPATNPATKKLHENIFISTVYYLQNHMFTVQLLPEVTQLPSTTSRPKLLFLPSENKSRFGKLTLNQQALVLDLEKQIVVLEEQESLLEQFIKDALAARKSDDAHSLMDNLTELQSEIDGLKARLSGVMAETSSS